MPCASHKACPSSGWSSPLLARRTQASSTGIFFALCGLPSRHRYISFSDATILLCMERSLAPELMDDPGLPEAIWENFHRELMAVHRILGNTGAILDALSRNVRP